MDGVTERIEDRRDLVWNRVVEPPDVDRRHCDVVCERAVRVDADDHHALADVGLTRPAEQTGAARNMPLGRHTLANGETAHRGTECLDRPDELVPDDKRRLNPALGPGVPGVDVVVRPADPGFAHADQYVGRSDPRHGDLAQI